MRIIDIIRIKCDNTKDSNSLLILAHKDIDGACSAAMLYHILNKLYSRIEVVFVDYNTLVKTAYELVRSGKISLWHHVALVDVGARSDNIYSLARIFDILKGRLKIVFDHHVGWKKVIKKYSNTKMAKYNIYFEDFERLTFSSDIICIDTKASSCCEVISSYYCVNDKYLEDITKLSIMSDDLSVRTDDERLNTALSKLKLTVIPRALKQLVWKSNIDDYDAPDINTLKYIKLTRQGELLKNIFDDITELSPGIGYISEVSSRGIDITSLFSKAYEKFRVLIIKEIKVGRWSAYFIIGHNIDNLDLTKVFNVKAGNPRRVTIVKREDIGVRPILNKLLKHVN